MRKNTDQKNSEYGHCSRSALFNICRSKFFELDGHFAIYLYTCNLFRKLEMCKWKFNLYENGFNRNGGAALWSEGEKFLEKFIFLSLIFLSFNPSEKFY